MDRTTVGPGEHETVVLEGGSDKEPFLSLAFPPGLELGDDRVVDVDRPPGRPRLHVGDTQLVGHRDHRLADRDPPACEVDVAPPQTQHLPSAHPCAGFLGEDVAIGERRFAVGDDILATRNDYRIPVLNGTRATIASIDRAAERIEAVGTGGRRLVIPFGYAEAGHLTHGYATTLHKAQGATLDQTFVLADDTLHRERSYSGLSRGVEGNDLYLAVPEDDDHHGSPDNDDLIEQLGHTVNRSDAKTLALDDLLSGRPPAPRTRIDELWAERRRLAPIVNRAPHPPFDELRALERDQQRAAANLVAAQQEHQTAQEALDGLGGHRRFTRRRDHQRAEARLRRAEGLETGAESVLSNLGNRRTYLEEQVAEWTAWTAQHGHEASRLREVDAQIAEHHRQHHPTLGREHGITRDIRRDVGIDLGL